MARSRPWFKAQRGAWEAKLKVLKKPQKLARPLPTRLQAASGRFGKQQIHVEELRSEVEGLDEKLQAKRKELEEGIAKLEEAVQELEAVKLLAAEGTMHSTVKLITESMALVLGTRHGEGGCRTSSP